MDWRILTAITVLCWGAYCVLLKVAGSRMPWQVSMLWFIIGYATTVVIFGLLTLGEARSRFFQPVVTWALVAGFLCGVGGIAFFKAVPSAPGSVFIPLVGLNVVVAAIGCLVFLHEPVSFRVIAGIVCATAAIMLLGQ